MPDGTYADATALLRATREGYEASDPGMRLRPGTHVDVATVAQEHMGLSSANPRYQSAVDYLVRRGALEPDPSTYAMAGGPLYFWGPHADDILLAEE